MKVNMIVLLSFLLALSTNAFFDPWGSQNSTDLKTDVIDFDGLMSFTDQKSNWNFTRTQNWFHDQKVDHYDLSNQKTWKQRYWIIADYYNKEANGPVFTITCANHGGYLEDYKVFLLQLAQKFGALIIVLEHRFYGLSQPFGDKNLTIDRLSYLTVDQVLADWAYFIQCIKECKDLALSEDTKFIAVGGDYAGALSAWFREKYPYLIDGAYASSPIIDSFINFPEYDEEVYSSLIRTGPECVYSIQAVNKYVEDQLYGETNNIDIKKLFNASKLSNEEFLYYWSDSLAYFVEAGRRTELCNLLSVYRSVEAQFDALRQYITQISAKKPKHYGSYYLTANDYDINNEWAKQWTWQRCYELGWFTTAPTRKSAYSLRSPKLNISFYKNWCSNIFNETIWPEKGLANLQRGGKKIQVDNLIITNSVEDPWKAASLIKSDYSGITTYYIDCDNCAHCSELRAPKSTDSWSLWWTRQKIRYHISKWIYNPDFIEETA